MSLLPTEEDKAQSRGYAEGLADGKKERYVKLRQGLISRLTTQELLHELYKRDGVDLIDCPIHCNATIQRGNGKYSEISFGESTIIVVRKP